MCTVTWLLQSTGYRLFFNRDELKTRGIARPPAAGELNRVKYIAPADADAGGSWIGVNEFGVAPAILNYYHAGGAKTAPGKDYISRGVLLKSLLDCREAAEALRRLQQERLENYRPFILLIFAPAAPPLACTWNAGKGGLKIERAAACPLSSSSFDSREVIEGRITRFRERFSGARPLTAEMLRSYHRSHEPEPGPYSVCMHREDAHTVSYSEIGVATDTIEFRYVPGSPCSHSFLAPITLPRKWSVIPQRGIGVNLSKKSPQRR